MKIMPLSKITAILAVHCPDHDKLEPLKWLSVLISHTKLHTDKYCMYGVTLAV